jgi:hypothetical protein
MLLLLLLPLLPAGCGDVRPGMDGTDPGAQELAERAPTIGTLMRAASVCRVQMSAQAQDRAARIEAAALRQRQRQGGVAARDAFLAAMQPPAFDPRQRGRDRMAWCSARQAEIARLNATLGGPEGAALADRAEAALR